MLSKIDNTHMIVCVCLLCACKLYNSPTKDVLMFTNITIICILLLLCFDITLIFFIIMLYFHI